jgi:hypothetical protein
MIIGECSSAMRLFVFCCCEADICCCVHGYSHTSCNTFVFHFFRRQYSAFTLFMILTFEATVVFSRIKSLSALRGMGNAPRKIRVFREGVWTKIWTTELLPGHNEFDEDHEEEEEERGWGVRGCGPKDWKD